MIEMIEIDSCYHLASSKSGVVWGAGLTKGSEGMTTDGDSIKAGKFPCLFYGYSKNQKRDMRTQQNNSRIQRRVNRLLKKSLRLSSVNQGTLTSA